MSTLRLLPVLALAGCPYLWGPPELSDEPLDTDLVVDVPDADADADADVDADTDADTDTDTPIDTDPSIETAPTTDTAPPIDTSVPVDTDLPIDTSVPIDTDLPIDTDPPDTDPPIDTDPPDTNEPVDTSNPPDTSNPTVVPEPPDVDSFTAVFRHDEVELTFTLSDPDGDLAGGGVRLSIDGAAPTLYDIPGELDTWDGATGTIVLATGSPCAGISDDYTLTPSDAGGNAGAAANSAVDVAGHTVVEMVGDYLVGPIALPAILCGNLSNSNDVDVSTFDPLVGGTWTFTLAYVGANDRDFELQDALGVTIASAVAASNPDSLAASVTAGLLYKLEVYAPGGGAGSDWTLTIHE